MAITDYASLQTNILNYLSRNSDTDAVAMCPIWIQLAEDDLRMNMNRLMVWQGETKNTSYPISTEYTALPTGFIRQRLLRIESNPPQLVDYMAPQAMDRMTALTSATGKPRYFTVEGAQLRVCPPPDVSYTTTFIYWTLPSLSNSATTNWLLTNHPKIYLNVSLAEASDYYGDDEGQQEYAGEADRLLSMLAAVDSSDKQGSAMRMRVDSGTP